MNFSYILACMNILVRECSETLCCLALKAAAPSDTLLRANLFYRNQKIFEHFAYQNILVFKGKELRNSGRKTNSEDGCSLTWQSLIDSDYVRLFHFIAANV